MNFLRSVIISFILICLVSPAQAQQQDISVAIYDGEEELLQIMFEDGSILLHEEVPGDVYALFADADLSSSHYYTHIATNYPGIEPDPFMVTDLGPVDEDYVASLKPPPPALMAFTDKAVLNAVLGGEAALREVNRYADRTNREIDDRGQQISSITTDYIRQARGAVNQAVARMKRQEYRLALEQLEFAAEELKRLTPAFSASVKNASSVSIREQHQASHFIRKYSELVAQADRALRGLCKAVEPGPGEKPNNTGQ